MKRKFALALLVIAAGGTAGSALAQADRYANPLSSQAEAQPWVSTRTRAEVKAELAQADRYANPWALQDEVRVASTGKLTREAVRAEMLSDRTRLAGNPYAGQ